MDAPLPQTPHPHARLTVTQLGAGVTKRATVMADGRELIYYDDPGTSLPEERLADTRPLDPRPPVAEMRQDVLTGEWISIAAARQKRAFLPPAELD
ncbi:MAG TPA: galactose-1-phosphate uridylyltransferase, partial [Pseudoclavibacter sp.]|nr:galactose-1-phosphate uridylyltransferase [Pseudoclavibacter sp.]